MSAPRPRKAVLNRAGGTTYKSPNRGLALLDEAIEQIEIHSALAEACQWYQDEWRCGSGMCLAGWVCQLAGGKWITPADGAAPDYLVPEADDSDEDVESVYMDLDTLDYKVPAVHVQDRAERLLGLRDASWGSETDDGWLFAGSNDLAEIKRLRQLFIDEGRIS